MLIIEHFPNEGAQAAKHCKWRSLVTYRKYFFGIATYFDSFNFVYPHAPELKTMIILTKGSNTFYNRAMTKLNLLTNKIISACLR